MTDERMFGALDCAVTAAEAAAQATVAIWEQLSPSEQDRWLEDAEICWPRRDIFLKTILPAAQQMIADERNEDAGGS